LFLGKLSRKLGLKLLHEILYAEIFLTTFERNLSKRIS